MSSAWQEQRATWERRNAYIDFLRFLFCIFVCLFHWDPQSHFGGGYLGVDFFFILSGFFLMQGFERKQGALAQRDIYQNCREYLWRRLCRFYPHYLAAFLFTLIVKVFVYHIVSFHDFLLNVFWELSFLQNIGLTNAAQLINDPTWFLCATLLGSYVVYFLLQRCRGFFLHFIAPFSVIFLFCAYNQKAGQAGLVWNTFGVTTGGIIRGFVELSLGCLTFKAYAYCRGLRMERSTALRALQTLLEAGTIGLICLMCYREGKTPKDFVLIMLFTLLIISTALNSSALAAFCACPAVRPILNHLGELSFSIYLSHRAVIYIIKHHLPPRGYFLNAILFLAATFLASELLDGSVRAFMRRIREFKQKGSVL